MYGRVVKRDDLPSFGRQAAAESSETAIHAAPPATWTLLILPLRILHDLRILVIALRRRLLSIVVLLSVALRWSVGL